MLSVGRVCLSVKKRCKKKKTKPVKNNRRFTAIFRVIAFILLPECRRLFADFFIIPIYLLKLTLVFKFHFTINLIYLCPVPVCVKCDQNIVFLLKFRSSQSCASSCVARESGFLFICICIFFFYPHNILRHVIIIGVPSGYT